MPSVLLFIPPDYDYNFPPLGTPVLTGFLKSKGINTIQRDLNIAYMDFLASRIKGGHLNEFDKRTALKNILKTFFIEKLKNRYYSKLLPRYSDKIFPYLPYDNNSNSSFYFTERILSAPFLFRYLADKKNNTFYQFFTGYKILSLIKKEQIGVLGISVISPSQVLPALTLGLLVKKHLPYVHVTLGGQWVTLFRDELRKRKDLFKCFDSLIPFEGEMPLYELVKAIDNHLKPKGINIITKNQLSPQFNYQGQDLNALPCPDFSGLPLNRYDEGIKTITLTYETSRGCYWNKCAYCVDLPLPKPAYRVKNADLLVKEIKELMQKFNAKIFMMGDPGMSPRQMREVSCAIIKNKLKITWWTMARLDSGFNEKIFKLAKKSGLWQINFGFESANDNICAKLNKGNRRETSKRVIEDCSKSGVKVVLQTMLGLPGETYQEGLDTVNFLVENKKNIADVTFNTYYLTPANYVYRNPGRYKIVYDKKKVLPFQFFIPFENKNALTLAQAQLLINLYYQLSSSKEEKTVPVDYTIRYALQPRCGYWRQTFDFCGESIVLYFLKTQEGKRLLLDKVSASAIKKVTLGYDVKTVMADISKSYGKGYREIAEGFFETAVRNGFLKKVVNGK